MRLAYNFSASCCGFTVFYFWVGVLFSFSLGACNWSEFCNWSEWQM